MKVIRLGTRKSSLAVRQTEIVIENLKKYYSDIEYEMVFISTKGDRILDRTLSKVGGKGLFVKEIQEKLYNGEIDLAVHSMKDMPVESEEGLSIGAILKREDPRDVLVFSNEYKEYLSENDFNIANISKLLRDGHKYDLGKLFAGDFKIGTSSLRRQSQILNLKSNITVKPIRGNINTRLLKLDEEDLDATILAYAGLNRMNILKEDFLVLPMDIMCPAVGQGAIGVEFLSDRSDIKTILEKINHRPTYLEVMAERSFLRTLNGNCQSPIGCFAKIEKSNMNLMALLGSEDSNEIVKSNTSGDVDKYLELGESLAKILKQKQEGFN